MTFLPMLAYPLRNTAALVKTRLGNPSGPVWTSYGDPIPCRAWIDKASRSTSGEGTVVTHSLTMLTGLDVDLTDSDRIDRITDRSGNTLFKGRMVVDYQVRRRGHIEWSLGQGRGN